MNRQRITPITDPVTATSSPSTDSVLTMADHHGSKALPRKGYSQ
ncbi:Uncharacterised protein [Mycobacteroides abscessus subsp. abscessus]|nr:Uncharacterised protein [Mycobacteroides abscessus subsp. abscessus]